MSTRGHVVAIATMTGLWLIGCIVSSDVQAQTTPPNSPFGHSYEVKYNEARWWTMDVTPDRLSFIAKSGPQKDQVVLTVDRPTMKEIGSGIYLIYWQEKDKTTAVHVYDFAGGHSFLNTTKPDGTFINLEGSLAFIK